ncbi:cysteine desulfurase family protein [Leptothoe kymatousa]|uniref:cysteine desulfurase n=1 Tax=Leptothoe kymatousa TAU-MAC 1615 TaxID=2364775 RepID=A0ABS5XZ66_9CYAN|nr:IscS subfamily cysteine desulfurase [Leptothoe kymatousa]MBT9310899.1 IscS subfamily cysteine desulfurase [Leptothoe kymatousa TAU-MAC 1615]
MADPPIYLDCHATTPLDPAVVQAMMPFFTEHFGNPSSLHQYGWSAAAAINNSRETIAQAINAEPEEIIFTSGATEANNLAIKGVAEAYFGHGKHIITVVTEHSAVLDPCHYLESLGFEITYLPVQADGLLELAALEQAIRPDTILVSVMAANNEIGVLQPIREIGELCESHEILFHTDAAQAVGKIPLNVRDMNIHLMSMTAHKVYGPKGIGALYVRRRNPRVNLAAQLHGGGHERGLRSGTLYPPQIVGFAKAMELAMATMATEQVQLGELRSQLLNHLTQLSNMHLNGHPSCRLPGNLNVSFRGVDAQALLLGLQPMVALSSGSACSSTSTAPSHVLKALGHSDQLAYTSLRFGLGRFTTAEEVDQVGQAVVQTVEALRDLSSRL